MNNYQSGLTGEEDEEESLIMSAAESQSLTLTLPNTNPSCKYKLLLQLYINWIRIRLIKYILFDTNLEY